MVAYSFHPGFVPAIESGTKRQTIRLPRRRHARPGEPVQLFVGMRTRACRKIIPDPVCIGVDEVIIDLSACPAAGTDWLTAARVEVNGIPIVGAELDTYAQGDGFGRRSPDGVGRNGVLVLGRPGETMLRWWALTHGAILFEGVAIRWELAVVAGEPQPGGV